MKVQLFNKISAAGLQELDGNRYEVGDQLTDYDAILVRSASLHEMEFPASLKCIARAGAGVNNIPLQRCSEAGIVVFTPLLGTVNQLGAYEERILSSSAEDTVRTVARLVSMDWTRDS